MSYSSNSSLLSAFYSSSAINSNINDSMMVGGFRVVPTIKDRDNIEVSLRKWGMVVYVQETDKFYYLKNIDNKINNNANWILLINNENQSTLSYTRIFTQNDLENGILIIKHNLNLKNAIGNVTIKDDNSRLIYPDDVTFVDKNTIKVDLRSIEPIDDQWTIIITGIKDTIKELKRKPILNEPGSTLNNIILG